MRDAKPFRAVLPALLLAGGCAGPSRNAPPALPVPLPTLPVEQLVDLRGPAGPRTPTVQDPLDQVQSSQRVTLSATGVSLRALLPALAEAAGVSLVLGPEVQGQISVNLVDVPAVEALRAVLAEAGLSVVSGPPAPLWGPVVFYTLPVDIERASVEMIMARYDVSREMAEWIVASRHPR